MFQAADVGKNCEGDYRAIKDKSECMLAHHAAFYDTTFHEISADAICNDLPPGCVVERGEVPPHLPKRHSVYWNPNGTTISLDKRVRPICRKTKGKYLLLLDTIYSSILEISEP